jgi:hypothetical protein
MDPSQPPHFHDSKSVHAFYASPFALLGDEDDSRCGYSSKRCSNPRTTKKGGGLHRFCEFHRRRANRNQWRVDDKRRGLRAARRQQLKQSRKAMALSSPSDPLRKDTNELLKNELPMTREEIDVLLTILFDDATATVNAIPCMATQPLAFSSSGMVVV